MTHRSLRLCAILGTADIALMLCALAAAGSAACDSARRGDLITMQLQLDAEGLIADVAFSGRGCAISQASASLLTDELRGKRAEEITALGSPYVMELLGVEVGPSRIHCALLGLETTQKAIATWRNKV